MSIVIMNIDRKVQVGRCLVNNFNKEIAFADVTITKYYYEVECDDPKSLEAQYNYDLNSCETLEEIADVLNYYEDAIFGQGSSYYVEEVAYKNGVRIA